jgi:hypothetical protein
MLHNFSFVFWIKQDNLSLKKFLWLCQPETLQDLKRQEENKQEKY